MIEVMRAHGGMPYEMCEVLTPLLPCGSMPKYACFQGSDSGDVFIGHMSSGCWCEIKKQMVAIIMNDLNNKIKDKK